MDKIFLLSVLTMCLYCITMGMTASWNSPVLPKLLSNDTDVNPFAEPITYFQVSILLTLAPLGGIMGTLLVGKVPDLIGRRGTLRYLSILLISSYIALSFGKNIYVFYVFLTTIVMSGAGTALVIPMYTAEIAQDRNRGKLGGIMSVAMSIGQFLTYLIGPAISVQLLAFSCSLPVILALILTAFIPESPVYLASKEDLVESINGTRKPINVNPLNSIEQGQNERTRLLQNQNENAKVKFRTIFASKAGRKAFTISIGLEILQSSSGLLILMQFLGPLFNEAGSSLSGDTLATIMAAAKIVAAGLAINFVERVGRRTLILIGSSLCSASMFVFGIYLYLKNNNFEVAAQIPLLPILAISCFILSNTFGLNSTISIVISEVLPNEYRAVGTCIVILVGGCCMALISFAFPLAGQYLGMHYCMFGFSLFSFIGFVFTFLTVPETKCKSFSEIRTMLNE